MTESHAIITAEVNANIANDRYQDAFDAHEHPEILDVLATEADIAQRYFEDLLMSAEGNA